VLSADVRIFILTVAVSIINISPLGVDNIIFYHNKNSKFKCIGKLLYFTCN